MEFIETAIVSAKGQVTIPKALRESLGIDPGDELEFRETEDGRLVVRRIPIADPIDTLSGLIPRTKGQTTNAILTEARGPAWNPKIDGDTDK